MYVCMYVCMHLRTCVYGRTQNICSTTYMPRAESVSHWALLLHADIVSRHNAVRFSLCCVFLFLFFHRAVNKDFDLRRSTGACWTLSAFFIYSRLVQRQTLSASAEDHYQRMFWSLIRIIIIIIIIITTTIFIVLSSTAPAICESSMWFFWA